MTVFCNLLVSLVYVCSCLSVRPSVIKRVIYDKMEERSVQIFISYERSFSL